jgi:hypothetical protein
MLEKVKSLNLVDKAKALIRKPVFLAVVGFFLVLFLCAASYGIWLTQQPPEQPIQFNHSVHVGFGVQCLYCHPGAWKSASAGIPTQTKCWGCHQQFPVKNAEQQKLADAVANNEPIQWVPVFIMPDFVYFNHRPHINAGVACESCHGDVSQMGYAQPYNLNMGFCLHCHNQQPPEKVTRLIDCATCHR